MNPVSMNIFDSYAAMTPEQKEAVLSNIFLDELHWEDDIKVRLGELLMTEQDDLLLSLIIKMLGGCLEDAEFRKKLSAVTGKYPKNSLSYNAVRELMITAFFVNSEDVKSWGASQLKEKEKIDTNNETNLVNYLRNLLEDFNVPLHLRWNAALSLANYGTPNAIDALLSFAQYLIKRLPKNETDNYYDNENQFLAEKIAYCIGFAADKILLPEQIYQALVFLLQSYIIIDEITEESSPIQCSIERIYRHITNLPVKLKISFIAVFSEKMLTEELPKKLETITYKPIRQLMAWISGQIEQLQPKPLKIDDTVKAAAKWIFDSIWIPEGTGQLLSAADNSRQEKSFFDGTVKIACIFRGEINDDPAYIWLSWDALKTPEHRELIIQLVNPDTREVLFELCLGDLKEGEQAFVAGELGFDPTKTLWAINVGLREIAK